MFKKTGDDYKIERIIHGELSAEAIEEIEKAYAKEANDGYDDEDKPSKNENIH